jgi:hypothetical protein
VAERLRTDLGLRRLWAVRDAAARTRFEHHLLGLGRDADPGGLAERFRQEVCRAAQVPVAAESYVDGLPSWPRSLARLRAHALEAQLRDHLRQRFGRDFWRRRPAWRLLQELWNTGGTYGAEQLAAELGLGPITLDRLLDDLLAER